MFVRHGEPKKGQKPLILHGLCPTCGLTCRITVRFSSQLVRNIPPMQVDQAVRRILAACPHCHTTAQQLRLKAFSSRKAADMTCVIMVKRESGRIRFIREACRLPAESTVS